MTYIQINIGRNRNDTGEPLNDTDWMLFQVSVLDEIIDALPWIDFGNHKIDIHRGLGKWNGVAEESVHISTYWDNDDPDSGIFYDLQLRQQLSNLKIAFHQDNIALIITESELI